MKTLRQMTLAITAACFAGCCHTPRSPSPLQAVEWECDSSKLSAALLEDLQAAGEEFLSTTSTPIRIVSGHRSLRRQAELMAEFSNAQLEGMYCRNGYPSYIKAIVDHRQTHGITSAADVYDILCSRTEGYISSHLSGAAVDIAPPEENVDKLKAILGNHGFRVLDERSMGVDCIHATHTPSPIVIIRE